MLRLNSTFAHESLNSQNIMSTDDSRLFEILEQLTDRLSRNVPVELDRVLAENADLSDDIRSLWATILVAENLGPSLSAFTEDPAPFEVQANFQIPNEIGDYILEGEIGRGGMGVVYRARQKSLNRAVAVKMLLRNDLANRTQLARFQSEAESGAGLDHPHIVSVFEVGDAAEIPFFSMQLIEGTTLSKRIAEAPLSNRDTASLMIPICRAIAHAHRSGILHRDLKPSNILIDAKGVPYVSDFGLAKRFSLVEGAGTDHPSLTESGAILGTPGYMAPEQAVGDRGIVSKATDIYSLGAIVYACLTGRAPFQAASPVDAILMILEQDPPLPRLLNPQIDVDLELIVLKAMQKPADLRYDSADELADDLQAYLNNEPVSARSSHFSQVLSRAFRPTHHAGVLENWGLLWMLHACVLFVLCIATDFAHYQQVESRWFYVGVWCVGLGAWAAIFWKLRHLAGPVTFVERQIAHVWAASMASSSALYGVEYLLDLPVLKLSPVLALITGSVFVVKAGILSGEFYVHAVLLFLTAIPMALFPSIALTIFGLVAAGTFFVSGLKFYQLKRLNRTNLTGSRHDRF